MRDNEKSIGELANVTEEMPSQREPGAKPEELEYPHDSGRETKLAENPVNPELFKAFLKGISSVPTKNFDYSLFTLAQALQSHTDWEKFFNSQLSPKQLYDLGHIMNEFHERIGVAFRFVPPEQAQAMDLTGVETVPIEELSRFWTTAIKLSKKMISNYFAARGVELPANIQEIWPEFLNDHKNKELMEDLKHVVLSFRDAFKEPAVTKVLRQLKARLQPGHPKHSSDSRLLWFVYQEDVKSLVLEYIKRVEPRIPDDIADKILSDMVKH